MHACVRMCIARYMCKLPHGCAPGHAMIWCVLSPDLHLEGVQPLLRLLLGHRLRLLRLTQCAPRLAPSTCILTCPSWLLCLPSSTLAKRLLRTLHPPAAGTAAILELQARGAQP